MGKVIHLKQTLLYYLVIEMRVWVPERGLPKASRVEVFVGPFFTPKERTLWRRAFWLELPLVSRKLCLAVRTKTLRFRDARRFVSDINPLRPDGDPALVADSIEEFARIKKRAMRSS